MYFEMGAIAGSEAWIIGRSEGVQLQSFVTLGARGGYQRGRKVNKCLMGPSTLPTCSDDD